jgi:hypothetical protein
MIFYNCLILLYLKNKKLIMKKILLLLFVFNSVIYAQTTAITATVSYQGYDETQGYLGQAEYQIFLDNVDGVLDKPIFLIDGFDPSDTRDIPAMYDLLTFNGTNLGDTLRDEGFDFVLLNFPVYTRASDNVEVDGGSDYIQRNAMVLMELINQINAQKVGSQPLVMVAPSMGGLITRYALRYMEQNNMDHDTRLFISWDTPHRGANMPIEMQYFLNYVAQSQNDQNLIDIVDATLNSPASKEMLLDHYQPHLQSNSTFEQDPNLLLPSGFTNFRDAFQQELDAMGFPQNTRNVAIANGSANGTTIGTPGMEVINHTFDLGNNLTADLTLHFTPSASQTIEVTRVEVVYLNVVPISTYVAKSESFNYTDGLDSAPGGKYDLQSFTNAAASNDTLQEFVDNLQQSDFCFIPTLSALAIDNETNWYATPDIGGVHNSPFVAWSINDTNEDHVTLNQQNVDFTLAEIRNGVVATSENTVTDSIKLLQNPIKDKITLLLQDSGKKINVSVYAINGQVVFKGNFISDNYKLEIPVSLKNGLYVLKVQQGKQLLVCKLVVNE